MNLNVDASRLRCTQGEVAQWAMQTLGLPKPPGKGITSRTFNDVSVSHKKSIGDAHIQAKICRKTKPDMWNCTEHYSTGFCDMRHKRRCFSGFIIKEKARELAQKAKKLLPLDKRIKISFSDGCLDSLKKLKPALLPNFYQMSPDRTIVSCALPRRKKQKRYFLLFSIATLPGPENTDFILSV